MTTFPGLPDQPDAFDTARIRDDSRPPISVADPRLNRIMHRDPLSCASLNEYAARCGIDIAGVVELLGPYLDSGTLALDPVGDEVFVHTAPSGRPAPHGHADVAPNLWEMLRRRLAPDAAYTLWALVRNLERAGWRVEVDPHRICFSLGPVREVPFLGIEVAHRIIPVVIHPSTEALVSATGPLGDLERAGANGAAVVTDAAALDEYVTATRRWMLAHAAPPQLNVLLLEAPRYHPTLVAARDAAVRPVTVGRASVELGWE